MNVFWLASFLVLWVLVISTGLVVLALAREIEVLHKRLASLQKFLNGSNIVGAKKQKEMALVIPEASVTPSQPSAAD